MNRLVPATMEAGVWGHSPHYFTSKMLRFSPTSYTAPSSNQENVSTLTGALA